MTGLWAVQLIPMICVETETFMLSKLNEENEEPPRPPLQGGVFSSSFKKAWRTASQLGPLMAHLFQQMDEWEPELTGHQNWNDWSPEKT